MEVEPNPANPGNSTYVSKEEAARIADKLSERIEEHDENRRRVQDDLYEACNRLKKQLEELEGRVNGSLEEKYVKEDAQMQEVFSELSKAINVEKEDDDDDDDEQKRCLTELVARAKAILLVKQSYELRKPVNHKEEKRKRLKNMARAYRIPAYGFFGDNNEENEDNVMEEENNDNDAEEENKDPDLTNLYELNVKSEFDPEFLCMREPEDLRITKANAGRVHMSFTKSFNAEEERVFFEHNILENVAYKAAVLADGAKKSTEYDLIKGSDDDEYWFSPQLHSDTMFRVCVRSELKGTKNISKWSDYASFVPSFSEDCGWMACPVNGPNFYTISDDNPMIVTSVNKDSDTHIKITPSISLPPNKVTSWSFKLVELDGRNGFGVFVGVSPLGTKGPKGNMGITCIGGQELDGWVLSCSSMKLLSGSPHNGLNRLRKSKFTRRNLAQGDVVGVVMDTIKGELSFTVNGVNMGVAFEGIPLDKPLMPCVYMGGGDSIELDLNEVKENVDSAVPVPSSVAAKSEAWNLITLTWDAVEGAAFYQIEVDGDKLWESSLSNSFVLKRFLPDAEHSFRVRAAFENSVSEWSDAVKGRTGALPDFSGCVWKIGGKRWEREYSISKKNPRIVTSIGRYNYRNITGSLMLPPNKVTSWNIKVHSAQATNDRPGFLIGVAPYYKDNEETVYFGGRVDGWYLNCSKSKLMSGPPHNIHGKAYGPRKEAGEYINAGDVIGVIMDMTKGELSFVVNGMNLGIAYGGIPLDEPLAPSAILSNPGDSVELDPSEVKLNEVSRSVQPPENIAVESRTWDSIMLRWDAVEGASFYQVEVDGASLHINTPRSRYSHNMLLPGADHNFRVRTVKDNCVSEWSDVFTGRTEDEYPDFSECRWKEAESAGKTNDDDDYEGKYRLDEVTKRVVTKTSSCRPCKVLGNVPLPPNKITSWEVKVLKNQGDERNRDFFLVGVSPCDSEDIRPTIGSDYETYFNCLSSTVQRGTYYERYYCNPPSKKPRKCEGTVESVGVVVDTAKGELSFVVNGVNIGVASTRIPLDKPLVPCVILGCSGDSAELVPREAKENVRKDIPTPPNITAKSSAWDSITLAWDPVEGASYYQIEVDGSRLLYGTTATNTFTKRGFLAESEHDFRIRAARENSVGEWSDVVKWKTLEAPKFTDSVWGKESHDDDNDDNEAYRGEFAVDKENPRVVTKIDGIYRDNFACITGSTPIPRGSVTSWSVKVLKSKKNDGERIYIGVTSPIKDPDRTVDEYRWLINCFDPSLKYGPTKTIYCLTKVPKEGGEYVHNGDSVGVVMDTTKGELSFVLNGVNLGVAFKGIPLDKPLVPCVLLGNKGDSVELDPNEVKENFDKSIPIPSNIAIKKTTLDSITLTWDAAGRASFYQFEVDGSKFWERSTTNTFTKRGLLPETEHTFRIRAVRGNSVGGWSDVVKGRTQKASSFSECAWKECPDDVEDDRKYSVDKSNHKIATKMYMVRRSAPIYVDSFITGDTPIPLNAVTSWSVKIIKSLNNDGKGICVGITQLGDGVHKTRSWYFNCYNSTLFSGPPHNYRWKEYGPRKEKGQYVQSGDSVGVVMDTAKGELSFVLNGVNHGVAFEGVPLDKPIVPCVLLKYEGDSVELVI